MAEVEIVPKPSWRNILTVTAAPGPSPPAGTAILTLDGPHGLTDDDGVWVSGLSGISGISEVSEQPITVIDPTSVYIEGSSISGTYGGGGIFRDASYNRHRIFNTNNRLLSIGGALYFSVYYIPSVARIANLGEGQRASVYKSTDDGATWVRQDAGNETSLTGNNAVGVVLGGGIDWHAYRLGSATIGSRTWLRAAVRPYDIAGGVWGTESPNDPLMEAPTPAIFPVVMSDGRIFVYYTHSELLPGSAVTDDERPAWGVYNPATNLWDTVDNYFGKPNNTIISATAGSPNSVQTASPHGYQTGDRIVISGTSGITNLNGTRTIDVTGPDTFTTRTNGTGVYGGGGVTHFDLDLFTIGLAVGDNDRIHLFYASQNNASGTSYQPGNLYQRTFDASTLSFSGDEQLITDELEDEGFGMGVPLAYVSGGVTKLLVPIAHRENTGGAGTVDKMQVAEADDAVNPSWVISDVSSGNPPPSVARFCTADAAYDAANDRIWLFWTTPDPAAGFKTSIVYNSKTVGGSWGSDSVFKTDAEYWYANAAPTVIGTEVRVVYDKVHPNEIATGANIATELELFPHIDVVSACPPCPPAANYAFFY